MLLEAVHGSCIETYQKYKVGADPLSNPSITEYLQGSFGCGEAKGFFPPSATCLLIWERKKLVPYREVKCLIISSQYLML